jgi:hypothetical protein
MLVCDCSALRDTRCGELRTALIGKKKEVDLPSREQQQSNRAFIAFGHPRNGYKPAPVTLHHQLQKSPAKIHRLLQHHIGAIGAVELDLLLDNG